jgi:hypothetical protein
MSHSNYNIRRIEAIDKNLKDMQLALRRAHGAGIVIEITVGGGERSRELTIELSHNLEAVFAEIEKGLAQSRREKTIAARSELQALQELVDRLNKEGLSS